MRLSITQSCCILKPPVVGLYRISGEVVSENDCVTAEKISYTKRKPLSIQFVPVAPCLLHAAPCGRKISVLFAIILQVLEYFKYYEIPNPFFIDEDITPSSLSLWGRYSSPLTISTAFLCTLPSLSVSFLKCGGPGLNSRFGLASTE